MMICTVTGYLEPIGSKVGLRFFTIEVAKPYRHSAFLEVEGDCGREDDDCLTEDMFPFRNGEVSVCCAVGADGDLRAKPSDFSHTAIATEARRAETTKIGSVHEGAGLKGIAQSLSGDSNAR